MGDHGRGSLKDLGDGKWRYWPPMTRGVRPPSKTIRAKTKREAWEKADAIRSQYLSGDYAPNDRTVADAIAFWLDTKRELSESSRLNYEHTLRKHTLPALGHVRLEHLSVQAVEQHYYAIPQSAAKNAHFILRQTMDLIVRWGWLPRSPIAGAKLPKARPRTLTPPDVDVVNQIFDQYHDERGTFFRLAAVSGCRRGELCALRWDDIGDNGMTIARSMTWGADGKPKVGEGTKTGAARWVDLGPEMLAELDRLRTERAAALGDRFKVRTYVFTRDDGTTPWHPITVSHWFRKAADAVGYTGRLHDLRHLHATALIGGGMSVPDVSARLGHARPATTMKVYAHAIPGRGGALAQAAESLILRPGS